MKPVDKKPFVIVGIVFALILIVLIGFVVYLFMNPAVAETLSHIATFFVALLMMIIALFLMALVIVTIYLALKINDLTQLLGKEVQPVIQNAQAISNRADETVKVVQNRMNLISDELVKPVITTVSFFSGVKAVWDTLFKRN